MQKIAFGGQLSPAAACTPWWVGVGSQGENVNASNLNQFDGVEPHQKSGIMVKSQLIMGQEPDKENDSVIQLDFSAGENKNTLKGDMSNHQSNNFQQFSPSEEKGYFELGIGQAMVTGNYPFVDQCQGLFTAYGAQPMERVMLPFSVPTEDGPIYVNPKQYHGILRRRKIRAKEGMQKRAAKEKPYLHESRHRHACRRPRGAGGRFLNTKPEKSEHEMHNTSVHQAFFSSQAQSSSSEVLQSDSVNFNSPNKLSDSKNSTLCGSEVTSMYYSKEFDCFGVSSSRPFAFHPLSNMMETTSADGCCDFFKI